MSSKKQENKQNTSQADSGLATVMMRNDFYKDHLKIARLSMYILVLINLVLGFGIFHKVTNPAQPVYFMATADGKLFDTHPYNDPVVSDAEVEQWAMNSLRATFSLDYIHYYTQLQSALNNFTQTGRSSFNSAFKANNNLQAIEANHWVCDIQMTGSPKIIAKSIAGNGRYSWKIQVPVKFIYSGTNGLTQTAMVTMMVQRDSIKRFSRGIAISYIWINQYASSETTVG